MADQRPLTTDQPAASPTAESARLDSLDVLRGVAVLGILAMNIQSFSMPDAGYYNPASIPAIVPFEGPNRWVYAVVHALFDMKMMAIFSMLFGAGVLLYARRAEGSPEALRRVRSRWFIRCAWLLVFGMIHAYFIWHGDILVLYALCGLLFLWWARRLPPWALFTIGGAGVLIAAALFTLNGVMVGLAVDPDWQEAANLSSEDVEAFQESMAMLLPTAEQAAATVAAFRSGYAGVTAERAELAFYAQVGMIPFWGLWRVGGLMLIGVALMKLRVLSGERSPRFYLNFALLGYAFGLTPVLLGLWLNFDRGFDPVWYYLAGVRFNEFGSVPMALGHTGLVIWLYKIGGLGGLARALAATGRMAFTNYIAQSVIATLIFYGYGLGMYGALDRLEQQGVVGAVWALQLAWSPLWLSRFRYGPLEWAWRSLTYGRALPISRAA